MSIGRIRPLFGRPEALLEISLHQIFQSFKKPAYEKKAPQLHDVFIKCGYGVCAICPVSGWNPNKTKRQLK